MVWIMLTMAFAATLAVHLGLPEAIAEVVSKVAKCEKCTSFWATAAVLWHGGADLIAIVALSIFAAYLSHWIGLLLIVMQKIFTRSWQRVNK